MPTVESPLPFLDPQPVKRLRRTVEFRSPAPLLHRLIVLCPIGWGIWNLAHGRELPPVFWWIVVAMVMFHLLTKTTPYLRLTPSGLRFAERDAVEIGWDEVREARNRASAMQITLVSGETIEIEYAKLRKGDVARLRDTIKGQFLALAAEARLAAPTDELEPQPV
jgi:hypothetical protein